MISNNIRVIFCFLLVYTCMYSVFRLFWLSYQYLPNDWQVRLLRKPIHGKEIIFTNQRLRSAYDLYSLVYYLIVLLFLLVPGPTHISHSPVV